MIKPNKTKAYQLICDECGSILDNDNGTNAFTNLVELNKLAEEYEWEPSGRKGETFNSEDGGITDAPLHFCSRKCLCKHFGWRMPKETHKCFCATCKKEISSYRKIELLSKMNANGWYGGGYIGRKLNIGSVHHPLLNQFYFCSLGCAKVYQQKHK